MGIPISRLRYSDARMLCPFHKEELRSKGNRNCRSCGNRKIKISLCKKGSKEMPCVGMNRCTRLNPELRKKLIKRWKELK